MFVDPGPTREPAAAGLGCELLRRDPVTSLRVAPLGLRWSRLLTSLVCPIVGPLGGHLGALLESRRHVLTAGIPLFPHPRGGATAA